MKTTVKLICSVISALLIVTAFCVIASAESNISFYAPADVQSNVYETLFNEKSDIVKFVEKNKLELLKDSIAPVYAIDLQEYAESDFLNVFPRKGPSGTEDVYMIKALTDKREYAGSFIFYVKENAAMMMSFEPSAATAKLLGIRNGSYLASLSYADHAERIKSILGLSEIIDPGSVRLVTVNGYGSFFYIERDGLKTLIPTGYTEYGADAPCDMTVDIETDLKKAAFDYVKNVIEHQKEVEEWGKAHPGEDYSFTGTPPFMPVISVCSAANNVTDIKGYFEGKASAANLSAPDAGTTGKTEENAANIWLPVGAAAAIIAVFAAGTVILIKKKAK